MAFAGGYSKAHPKGGKRSGGLGVRSFGKAVPFGSKSNLRGTSFGASGGRGRGRPRNGSLS